MRMKRTLSAAAAGLFYLGLFFFVPFLWEISTGILLFSLHFRKKERFLLRLALSLGTELLLGMPLFLLCYRLPIGLVSNGLCYLLLFGVALLLPFLCFEEPPVHLIQCAASGYMAQHVASQFSQTLWYNAQWNTLHSDAAFFALSALSRLAVVAGVYALLYLFFVRQTTRVALSDRENRSLLRLSVITLVVVILLSGVRDTYAAESMALMLVSRLFSVFCCVFLLYLRSGILEKGALEQEHAEMLRLHAIQQEQYEQRKETIELISIKCHDLKHRVERWEVLNGQVPQEELREMKRLVDIYDSAVKTGNETLDILLTERRLYCERHGIRLSCMADGGKLDFMPVGDICALFGNALENAVEAVSRLPSEEERVISVLMRERKGMLVITVDNAFLGELDFDGHLPKSTKGDSGWHGYGLKSIQLVAEQYGGQATVAVDELFHLTVLLPLPAQAARIRQKS